jgi:hypothetical protein
LASRSMPTTYDCIYFRPFNFRAADPMSRSHAVQYHSLPEYGWSRSRTEHPGQYEHSVHPVPNPSDWFTSSTNPPRGASWRLRQPLGERGHTPGRHHRWAEGSAPVINGLG